MRVIFAGTPEFARVALQALVEAGHTIALVLTQPDRPAGRGMKLQASAVKQYAQSRGFALAQPRSLRLDGKFPEDAAAARAAIAAAQADVMVVAAYGLILPQWVLDDMRSRTGQLGCLNIHGSLLPRWRGAAPIHRAIEAGDTETGVTIMQMDAGLDTGDMWLRQALPIEDTDTTASLHDRVAALGARMLLQVLDAVHQPALKPVPQPSQGITYAHKIEKAEAAIDWSQSAQTICRRIRAFNPFPVATAALGDEVFKVWAAEVHPGASSHPSGEILAVGPAGIAVAAMNSVVLLTELQRAGGKRLPAAEFVRGVPVRSGMQFAAIAHPAATAAASGG